MDGVLERDGGGALRDEDIVRLLCVYLGFNVVLVV